MVRNDNDKLECPCCQTPKPGSGAGSTKPAEAPKPAFKPTNFQAPVDASALFGIAKPADTNGPKGKRLKRYFYIFYV
jgi:hypothetical protein